MMYVLRQKTLLQGLLSLLLALLVSQVPASGYHYQIDVSTTFKQDAKGQLNALQMEWLYDPAMTKLLVKEEDMVGDKQAATLKAVADLMMSDLYKYSYFTRLDVNGALQQVVTVADYSLELTPEQRLHLRFRLPLVKPLALSGQQASLEMIDPAGTAILLYTKDNYVNADPALLERCNIGVEEKETFEHGEAPQTIRLQCR